MCSLIAPHKPALNSIFCKPVQRAILARSCINCPDSKFELLRFHNLHANAAQMKCFSYISGPLHALSHQCSFWGIFTGAMLSSQITHTEVLLVLLPCPHLDRHSLVMEGFSNLPWCNAEATTPLSPNAGLYATLPRNRMSARLLRFTGFPSSTVRRAGVQKRVTDSPKSPIARAITLPSRSELLGVFPLLPRLLMMHHSCSSASCTCDTRPSLLSA